MYLVGLIQGIEPLEVLKWQLKTQDWMFNVVAVDIAEKWFPIEKTFLTQGKVETDNTYGKIMECVPYGLISVTSACPECV